MMFVTYTILSLITVLAGATLFSSEHWLWRHGSIYAGS